MQPRAVKDLARVDVSNPGKTTLVEQKLLRLTRAPSASA
jgi:hypothetical protein